LADGLAGVIAGVLVLVVVAAVRRIRGASAEPA
jgi:hypothetical protein